MSYQHDLPHQTYYQATALADTYPSLEENIDCEVCIVGGGYAGLATALGLVERGVRDVVLLEAEEIGYGASGRNGGFVFGGYSLDNGDLLRQQGVEKARALYQLTLDAVGLIRRRIGEYQIDCEMNPHGVVLANWFDRPSMLSHQERLMRETFQTEWESWSLDKTRTHLRSERYFGALHEKNAFHFHPLKYARGEARVLRDKGVRIFTQSRVTGIDAASAQKCVRTVQGQVRAKQVVVCCGGYIENLYPQLGRAVLPIATYVMATAPLGERLQTVFQDGVHSPAVYDTRFAFDYYRPLADTRILWGGRISILERQPHEVARLLAADMRKVYPQLADVNVDFAWSGLMSYAQHKMPQIGQLPNGIWYAMGFGGHGVAPTTVAGELVANAIAHQHTLPAGLERYRLPPTFGPLGLMAAQCAYWYYELRDWMRE